jgi:hypothetical protein
MRYLKMLVITIIALFTFGSAMAQVVVKARIGGPEHHYRHHHRWHRHHEYDRRHDDDHHHGDDHR